MKICWDNLENVYISLNNNFRKGNRTYYLNICEVCGEECLSVMRDNKLDDVCSVSCSKKGDRNSFYNKIHSTKQKEKWSKERKGTNKGQLNPFFGKKHSKITKEKISGPRESMRGENHPRWNPSKKVREIRELREWRTLIFERDDWTCQSCYKRGIEIQAHHLDSYNRNPHLRKDIDNGKTLCKNCHIGFHKMFGFGNNTKEQYYVYVEKKQCLKE